MTSPLDLAIMVIGVFHHCCSHNS